MPSNRYVVTDLPASYGFSSVNIPAAALSFVQLPNIQADEVIFSLTTNDIALASSATPGSNYLPVKTSGTSSANQTVIQTVGNTNNLFIANNTAATAQTVSFMWKLYPRGV
jgi:hypothetical protein